MRVFRKFFLTALDFSKITLSVKQNLKGKENKKVLITSKLKRFLKNL